MKRICGLLVLFLVLAAQLDAQVMTTGTYTTSTKYSACTGDKVQLTGFTVTPANPSPGQTVTVKIDMKNLCGSSLNVPYTISRGSGVLSSGTKSVAAKGSASVQYNWTATEGNHGFDAYLDGANKLNESQTYRANNYAANDISLNIEGWNTWANKARTATRSAVRAWFAAAGFAGVGVAGPVASHGALAGPPMETILLPALAAQGVPLAAGNAIGGGFAQGWNVWAATVKVVGGNWYPSFLVYQGASAPPTANQPSLLAHMAQIRTSMSADALAQAIKARLPAGASAAGAGPAIDAYAGWAAGCFNNLGQTSVKNVMGSGSVPSYTPFTPYGMVIGTANGAPGHMTPVFC